MIEWCCCNFYQTGNMFMIVTVDSSQHPCVKRVKGGQMGRSDKVCLLVCAIINQPRFRFFYFRISNC